MTRMAVTGRFCFRIAAAFTFLTAAVVLSGCSTFHEKPGHSPFLNSKRHEDRPAKRSSMNPLSGIGSIFKKDEPRLAKSPEEFVGLPRPEL